MRLIDAPAVVAERGVAVDRCAVVTLGRESAGRGGAGLPCTRTGSWRFRGIACGLDQVRRRGPGRGDDRNRGETRVYGLGAGRMLLGGRERWARAASPQRRAFASTRKHKRGS